MVLATIPPLANGLIILVSANEMTPKGKVGVQWEWAIIEEATALGRCLCMDEELAILREYGKLNVVPHQNVSRVTYDWISPGGSSLVSILGENSAASPAERQDHKVRQRMAETK